MNEDGQVHGATFGKVPPELMHDLTVTDGATRLYAHMHWRYGQNHKNFEGQQKMADFMGVSGVTIRSRIAELEASDWVITIERGFNQKTGNFTTNFYHVFETQAECRDFRENYIPQEGEVLYEKPLPNERKSRKGKGGKNNLPQLNPVSPDHVNSGYVGQRNSGYDGGVNSGYVGQRNSGYDYPESVYPDAGYPETDINTPAPSGAPILPIPPKVVDLKVKPAPAKTKASESSKTKRLSYPRDLSRWTWEHYEQYTDENPAVNTLAVFHDPAMYKRLDKLPTKLVARHCYDLFQELRRNDIAADRYGSLAQWARGKTQKGKSYDIFQYMLWELPKWLQCSPAPSISTTTTEPPPADDNKPVLLPLSMREREEKAS